MKQLVRLNTRPSNNGKSFTYILRYVDFDGKRKMEALGHSDSRKAEKQRAQKEKQLKMGYVEPDSMLLNDFVKDSIQRTGNQVRESSRYETEFAMKNFIATIGNIDFRNVTICHAERYRQACLDKGNRASNRYQKAEAYKKSFSACCQTRAN